MMERLVVAFSVLVVLSAHAAQRISEDRDLLDVDLTRWDCLNRPEGSAKTPDGSERNRLKNRSAADLSGIKAESTDTAGFLKRVADFDAQTKGARRKDIGPAQRQQLEPLENQVVSLVGYLGFAYAGPPESTNCASVDFHDWHLEVFEKPPAHEPQPGDPTAIICEITPRTQGAIFRDNIRIQALAGFFRRPDLSYEPTGHKAQQIRVTGYLLWDDEHNGSADVGTNVRTSGANKYHNPWRSTAWEIHPVMKIELIERGTIPVQTAQTPLPAAPSPTATSTPVAAPTLQFVTILQPVVIRIPYGQTILPRGAKLPIAAHDGRTVTVEYLGGRYTVPVASTDFVDPTGQTMSPSRP